MNWLIFIDTNILLDFYRIRSSDIGLPLLQHINDNHQKLITGNQVEMEFKKNRQKVILDTINKIKTPEWAGLTPPAFLAETKAVEIIERNKKELTTKQTGLKKKLEKVLKNPVQNDPVYQTLQRLFKNGSEINLDRKKKIRKTIRSLAWKRYLLGYPPRKKDDTSMGDAVNWEWIVQCAVATNKNIIIASRDSDYGVVYKDQAILNDALLQEFKERVSSKRKIILTGRLTDAFKQASIPVTKKEEKQEQNLIDEINEEILSQKDRQLIALEAAVREIERKFGRGSIYRGPQSTAAKE